MSQSNISIILVDTQLPENVGLSSRAMFNFGIEDLKIVSPKLEWPSEKAHAVAVDSHSIVDNAKVYKDLKESLKDSTFVYATSSRDRSIKWPILNAEDAAKMICDETNSNKKISIIFGKEDRGLTNEELELANRLIEIPANPDYPVLNIAMSSQVIAYEIFKASKENQSKEWRDYPEDKPRYLMGVGTPQDIVEAVRYGIDMFDCVLPTRNARNGQLFTSEGVINIRNAEYKNSDEPIDKNCDSKVSQNYSRAYLNHLQRTNEMLGSMLATYHNIAYYQSLMRDIRNSIENNKLAKFLKEFYNSQNLEMPDGPL